MPMAVHNTRKTENVNTASNGFSSVEPGPPGKKQETLRVGEQDKTAETTDEDVENVVHRTA